MTQDFSQYIQPGRVHRRLYSDPEIFELEMQRIFGRAWVYVGHESQVKNPGDYFATQIGRHPVVMVRDEDGALRVIRNQCAHRGAMVVATSELSEGRMPKSRAPWMPGMPWPMCISIGTESETLPPVSRMTFQLSSLNWVQ